MNNSKGMTLIELLIVVAILGILAAIAVPAYVGQQKNSTKAEAATELEGLKMLEEMYFSENNSYAPSTGACAKDSDNVAAIQAVLPGFDPGNNPKFSYCIELNEDISGAASANCFAARAYGNTDTRVEDDVYSIDCTNAKDY